MSQVDVYGDFYRKWRRGRWLFRFDVRYRIRRLRQVADELGLDLRGKKVLDVGFGSGHMLASFPTSCELCGVEISESAVAEARKDARFSRHAGAEFHLVPENAPERMPAGPFDIAISSHTLEHVPDDRAVLGAILERLQPGGLLLLFVPIEEPGYNPDHVRCYSLRSAVESVRAAGFEVVFAEASMLLTGHVWKVITIPSRRRWPVLKGLVDALRLATLSLVPYRAHLFFDRILARVGVGPRQAFVAGRAPGPHLHAAATPSGR
jgi:SAM-dependent methyltransferase